MEERNKSNQERLGVGVSKGSQRPRKKETGTRIADWGFETGGDEGPWFIAKYSHSILSCCGEDCEEGDEIRADGEGGYQGRCCYPEGDD